MFRSNSDTNTANCDKEGVIIQKLTAVNILFIIGRVISRDLTYKTAFTGRALQLCNSSTELLMYSV